jgi:acetyl esterase/lipase
MPTLFFTLALISFVLVVNALRPVPGGPLSVGSFFLAWITSEMAPHWLLVQVVATAALVASGGLHGWRGDVALAASVLSLIGLVALVRQSIRAQDVAEAALADAGLAGAADDIGDDPPVKWWHLALAFRRRRSDVVRVRNVSYGEFGRRNTLDVFHRADTPANAPVLLQIHGGAWVIGKKEEQGRPLMLHMAAHGWVCVAPNYRLSPRAKFPDHIVDLKRALAWVREHIAEYGGDPSYIAVTGGSAGGHLTALVALSQNDPEYQPGFEDADTSIAAAVPYYGVYDVTNAMHTKYGRQRLRFLMERTVMQQKLADAPDLFAGASPLLRLDTVDPADIPPFFVIHGAHDSLVPVREARFFVDKLRTVSHQPVLYAELPGAQHAFDVFGSVRVAHVLRATEHFLRAMHAKRVLN